MRSSEICMEDAQGSTFKAALPYAVTSLAVGVAGTVAAVACTETAAVVAGIAAALIGVYAFFATVICGVCNSGKPQEFRANIGKALAVAAGSAISDIISQVVRAVLDSLIWGFIERRRS